MDPDDTADGRAQELLCRILPAMEWDRFRQTGVLEVPGSRGTYRICTHNFTRVLDAPTHRPRVSTCLQLTVPAPVLDRIITEYLLIRNDEDLYWRTANIFPAGVENRVLAGFLVALLDVVLLGILIVQLGG